MVRERKIPREENKDEIIPKEYMLKIVKTYAQKHFFLKHTYALDSDLAW